MVVVFVVFLFPSDAFGLTYTNKEYGLSMYYPPEWVRYDYCYDEENAIVCFTPDPDYFSTYLEIIYIQDNSDYLGLEGREYLSELTANIREWCNGLTFEDSDFVCSNFQVINSGEFYDMYGVEYKFIERWVDGTSFEKRNLYFSSPIGRDTVDIDIESTESDHLLYASDIEDILSSVKYTSGSTVTPSGSTVPTTSFSTYSSPYGFSIDYPKGWIIDDDISQDGITTFYVDFSPRNDDFTYMTVMKHIDDFDYRGLSDKQYQERLAADNEDYCFNANFRDDGYVCSDFSLQWSDTIKRDDGLKWHYITANEHNRLDTGQSNDIKYFIWEMPYGDDTWALVIQFDKDWWLTNLDGDMDKTIEFVIDIATSFTPGGQSTPTPTPTPTPTTPTPTKPELTCGPGTVAKGGQCVPVETSGGGCLIATAAFGSEMAPRVQFLREIRDNTVMSTQSGASFMAAFNTFYYSFSPTIADLERQNPVLKEAVKATITPLLSSLILLNYVDIDTESEMLGYGIGIILLNIGMYFVVPALLVIKLRTLFKK